MIQIRKSWTDFKAIISEKSLYFYSQDITPQNRIIVAPFNSAILFYHEMDITTVEEDKSESQLDYEENYESQQGDKTYCYWTESKTFTANTTSHHIFQLKNHCGDGNTAVDGFVFKGFVSIDSAAVRGDVLTVAIVDHDNVTGQGVDTVLGYLIRKLILDGGAQRIELKPPNVDFIVNRKKIPKEFHIRASLTTASVITSVKANFGIEFEY